MWGGRFAAGPAAIMQQINASIGVDKRLYAEDIQGSLAHAAMLAKQGIITETDGAAIDRMLNLNINAVMKNVRDVLPHMIGRGRGDVIVTSSLAAHYPTPWEPVYAASKWAIDCFVQTTRRQVFRHGLRVGAISPGPVVTGLLADWPAEKLAEARASGSLIDAAEVAQVVLFMLTRPRGMTIRDVVMLPTHFDL